MKNMSFFGYVRVSTDTQAEKGYGLDTQRRAIEGYSREQNVELVAVFEDRGISGTESVENDGDELISKRKGLVQLLSALKDGDKVVVLNTSRLWRSDIAKVLIRREIERRGGEVISIEQPRYSIHKKEPSEFLINGMFELLDEYERISITLKLAEGRTTKAKKGDKPAGVTPYGYKYSENKKKIIVSQNEADIVRLIFKQIQSGRSIARVASALNEEGFTTRRGKMWTKATVHGILKNPFYTGVLSHQLIRIPGNHEAIVSKTLYGKTQAALWRRRKAVKLTL